MILEQVPGSQRIEKMMRNGVFRCLDGCEIVGERHEGVEIVSERFDVGILEGDSELPESLPEKFKRWIVIVFHCHSLQVQGLIRVRQDLVSSSTVMLGLYFESSIRTMMSQERK